MLTRRERSHRDNLQEVRVYPPLEHVYTCFPRMAYALAGGGTLCGVAALVLLTVSTATDFWMQYRYSGSSANQGLWRFCVNHKCHAHTITVGEYGGDARNRW
ncbi:Lens fiber membrane intrinsic protein [Liparis tanakae]|uniref:Lens fiber membrane intrinsic protein n=1 Tax=Liparis tanakae TaxID=230148 RepID=A0A4Z2EFP6_9TELE|nr:Lens fiber membrane intrinsic protein [Liparis tanakae]